VLLAGVAAACGVGVAGAGVVSGAVPVPGRLRSLLGGGVDPTEGIPSAAEGQGRVEVRDSDARGRRVGFFTAVPAGSGGGAGLPVCLVLHGASATTADFRRFGLARFLTAAVQAGVPPFVLAGADGGRTFWRGDGVRDDPQRMLREEIPAWCAERGFDVTRVGAYGWSMGGHGALALGQSRATFPALRAVAALSPAISSGDEVFTGVARLKDVTVGLWCGLSDSLLPAVQELAAAMQPAPRVAAWSPGAHTRVFWNHVTPAAFSLVGQTLASGPTP
jgi:hypothetical protein